MLQRSVLIAIAAGIALTVATTAAPRAVRGRWLRVHPDRACFERRPRAVVSRPPSDVSRGQPLSGCVPQSALAD